MLKSNRDTVSSHRDDIDVDVANQLGRNSSELIKLLERYSDKLAKEIIGVLDSTKLCSAKGFTLVSPPSYSESEKVYNLKLVDGTQNKDKDTDKLIPSKLLHKNIKITFDQEKDQIEILPTYEDTLNSDYPILESNLMENQLQSEIKTTLSQINSSSNSSSTTKSTMYGSRRRISPRSESITSRTRLPTYDEAMGLSNESNSSNSRSRAQEIHRIETLLEDAMYKKELLMRQESMKNNCKKGGSSFKRFWQRISSKPESI
ncbi:unnamed protein product [Ambrosiozyma monospora]|uniref:Unnamed protein product n=1 Tax=Ambrosiozyma monospora TaxID=43982 RepID=A0ACB5T4I2_AMBMO|nr:unnamed protein product [Ambrosiozyma monospora]